MAEPRSFADIVEFTAKQKLAAACARQHPDATAEKPREAILDGLQMVAEVIAEDGYIFSPSGPKFARKCGDLTFQIAIQSDRNNVAGQRAAVGFTRLSILGRSPHGARSTAAAGYAPKLHFHCRFLLPSLATFASQPDGWNGTLQRILSGAS